MSPAHPAGAHPAGPSAPSPVADSEPHRWPRIRAASVLHEDEAVLALNKPTGISVMGERHDTDLVRLAEESGERLYPVHRIDKVTSGVVLFAKDLSRHGPLTRQFQRRTVDKSYLVITRSTGLPESGTIDLPLGVGRKNRVRVAANRADITHDPGTDHWSVPVGAEFAHKKSYPSRTTFTRLWADQRHTLLVVRPETGRRHQIRVHLAWIGHPIEGDPSFDRESAARGDRTCLHAWRLALDTPWAGADARLSLQAPPGPDFWAPLGDRLPAGVPAELLADARH